MEICAVGTVAILVMVSLGFKFKTYVAHKKELNKIRRENENNIAHIGSDKSSYKRMYWKALRSRKSACDRTSL